MTREFNLNVLRVLNRELGGNFDVSAFEHVARWNAEAEWMEMFVRSVREQTVRLEALELEVAFDAGELMRTEISAKFHLRRLAAELEARRPRDAALVDRRRRRLRRSARNGR